MPRRLIITADPPTPNGDLHVGHLSGPYLAADALARHRRARGDDVVFYCNFDAHQSYVVTTGLQLGLPPQEVVRRFSARIAATLAAYGVEPDLFGRPDAAQGAFVETFFRELYEDGALLERDEPIPYCGRCDVYLFEAYAQGRCPHCDAGCYGNGCEICGVPHLSREMVDPHCRVCNRPPTETRVVHGLFLPLARYQEELARYVESRRETWRPRLLELVLPELEAPLPDIPLTYPSRHGLPVTLPGFEGQVWNVRQEILPALIHTFERCQEQRGATSWDWRDGEDYSLVHFHGLENGFQYAVSFNTLVIASRRAWRLPEANVTNEFYLLEGSKFSTTRRHAIWGQEILERVEPDSLRFYLAWTNPEREETNFVEDEFRRATEDRLVRPWNEILRRLEGALSWALPVAGPVDADFAAALERYRGETEAAFEIAGLSLQRAARALGAWLAVLREEAAGLAEEAPADPEQRRRQQARLGRVLLGVRALALFAGPLLPRLSRRLRGALGGEDQRWESYGQPVGPPAAGWSQGLALPSLMGIDRAASG